VASFSASNLKGLQKVRETTCSLKPFILTFLQSSFVGLLLPVLAFLTLQPESGNFLSNLSKFKSLHPVICTRDATFETVVERMTAHKVHRLWVVENDKPLGLIAISDIFKIFIPWANK
jgi:predicted transcriptional regulator